MSATSAPELAAAGLEVDGLRVIGPTGVIVERVDLSVAPGETVTIVGESGSGKSMTAKAITGLLPSGVRAEGRVRVGGRTVDLATGGDPLAGLRGRQISLLLQNPFTSLSPMHRCGAQIAAALPAASRRRRTVGDEIARRLAEVDLPSRVARQYPFELSGGMRQRVALAASLASDPDVLIGDEPTTALDVTTQREVLDLLVGIQARRAMAFVLITHDLGVARQRADRIMVMYAGRIVEVGSAREVFAAPRHPYSAGLRDSDPPLDRRVVPLPSMLGSVPRSWEVGSACAFAPRCPKTTERCRTSAPELQGTPHLAACWHPLDGQGAGGPESGSQDVRSAVPDVGTNANTSDRSDAHGGEPGGRDTGHHGVTPLVRVVGLVKAFSPSGPPALDEVSIEIGRGEAVGIVGESGSGKTTLARCLVGLERPTGGIVHWHTDVPGEDAPASMARRAQVVFQDPASALNPAMTIGAALSEASAAAPVSLGGGDVRTRQTVPELLDLVGLPATYARRRPAALSGGEQQRVAVARALAPSPELLICDEPVSSLDVSVQAQILNLLSEVHRALGLAILFITHDLAVVRQIADRLYVMRNGRVVESGATDVLLHHPSEPYTRALFASVPGAEAAISGHS